MLALALAGCGSGDEAAGGGNPSARADGDPSAGSRSPARGGDGTITGPSGRVIRNWGDRRERLRTLATFRGIVADFRAGRMAAACEHVSDFSLESFPDGAGPGPTCPQRMRLLARRLERRGARSRPLRLLWVRSYAMVSGIWVEDHLGIRFRVPFLRHGDDWRLEVGVFTRPDVLAAELVGPG